MPYLRPGSDILPVRLRCGRRRRHRSCCLRADGFQALRAFGTARLTGEVELDEVAVVGPDHIAAEDSCGLVEIESVLAGIHVHDECGAAVVLHVDVAVVIDVPAEVQGLAVGDVAVGVTVVVILRAGALDGVGVVLDEAS